MAKYTKIIEQDLQHIWHPCTQMKDFETCPPIVIKKARGAYLETDRGLLIDGISSWWCKSLGHNHPRIQAAIKKQMQRFDHVIATTTTHSAIAALGEKLAALSKKQHIFFASDGASAIEIALKLALHKNKLQGKPERQGFIALKNGYHGETLGTLAISDLGLYKKPYAGFGPACHFIDPIPYVSSNTDPLWSNASKAWERIEKKLDAVKAHCAAVIVEPIIQGVFGMQLYSADFLNRLYRWAKANDLLFISDEIMTGLYRTGTCLASEQARIDPDLICLSKGLTSGTIPLSVVLVDNTIFELFYRDYDARSAFLHSHTYSGNALGVAAALATLETMIDEAIEEKVAFLSQYMLKQFVAVADASRQLENIRSIGAIVAADMKPLETKSRISFTFYQKALEYGALLRPIGKTLYWLPPLNTDKTTVDQLAEITMKTLSALYR